MEFKDRIEYLRTDKRLSYTELGALFGKTESATRAWELGRSKPDADTLIKLAEHFNCTTDYLLGVSDYKNEKTRKSFDESIEKLIKAFSELMWIGDDFPVSLANTLLHISNLPVKYNEDKTACLVRNIISEMGRLARKSTSMKYGSSEFLEAYCEFVRGFEYCQDVLDMYKMHLISTIIDSPENIKNSDEIRRLFYGTEYRDIGDTNAKT